MMADRADAGLQRKRETQLERVTAAIQNLPHDARDRPGDIATAAIAAYPDPYAKKERDRLKMPTDDCILCAMRSEFVGLVQFIEEHAGPEAKPLALARALREQGVV